MVVDGNYSIEIDTPIGKQTAKLVLETEGNALSGSIDARIGGVQEFTGGTVNGEEVTWSMVLESPMGKIGLDFRCKVIGGEITGDVKAGNFGTFPLKGKRV